MLGTQELATLLSTDRAKQMSLIQNDVNTEAQNFGIEIVDVKSKELTYLQLIVKRFIPECKQRDKGSESLELKEQNSSKNKIYS